MRIQKVNPPVEVELPAVRSRARVIFNSLAQAVIFFYILLVIFSTVLFCFHFVLLANIFFHNVLPYILMYILFFTPLLVLIEQRRLLILIEQRRVTRNKKGAHTLSFGCNYMLILYFLEIVLLCSFRLDDIFYEVCRLINVLLNVVDPISRLILILLTLLINVLIDGILLIEHIRLTQKKRSVQIPSFRSNYVLDFVIPMCPWEARKALSSSHFYCGFLFRLVLYCFSLFLPYFSYVLHCSLKCDYVIDPIGCKGGLMEFNKSVRIPWRCPSLFLVLYAQCLIAFIRFTWERKSVCIRAFGCDYVFNFVIPTADWEAQKARWGYINFVIPADWEAAWEARSDYINFIIPTAAWEAQNARSDYMHDSDNFEPQESPVGKFRRSINSWQRGVLLGSGSFGTVYEGFTDDGFFFAVKEVSFLFQGSIDQLEQDIVLLRQFEHDNIVQYLGTDKDKDKLYIFLELVTQGSLESLYKKYPLQDSQVSSYTRQIVNGLKYLHDRNVVHRDIKCANILVDASGNVKLADFGLAKVTKSQDIKSCKGTPFWMAPEVVKNNGYGLAADIWSLGCTVLEMLTGCRPYSDLENMQALFRIGKGKRPQVPKSLSRDARDFIFKCLQVNKNNRPTAAQLLEHPFVKKPLQISLGPTSPHHSVTPS